MSNYIAKSAVLFLVFNRPDTTERVFETIRVAEPPRLYIASDGPRKHKVGEEEKVKTVRDIVSNIDWECEVKTLYREDNLGCGKAVSSAITWFFDHEEQGIILEDDCLPSSDFFRFCDYLLEKYQYDERIGHISGVNFQRNIKRGEGDYYFSKLTHVWGWASWKRVWDDYDFDMKHLDQAIKIDLLSALTAKDSYRKSFYSSFSRTKTGEINTWDYQYFFLNQINSYLSIIPNYNLVSNIGFNHFGTHTQNSDSFFSNISISPLPLEIKNPKIIYSDYIADKYTLNKIFTLNFKSFILELFLNLKNKIISK